MAADDNSAGPQPQQSDGANGARPLNGTHLHCKYGILDPEDPQKTEETEEPKHPEEPEEPEGDRVNTGARVRGEGHGATRGTAEEGLTATETVIGTGQRVLLARGMLEEGDKEISPPTSRTCLTCATTQGGEEGGNPSPGSACLRRAARGRRVTPRNGSKCP